MACATLREVAPTVGALVEGWLLVVPRKPALSVGAMSGNERSELTTFCAEVSTLIQESYGPVVLFEHGPVAPQSSVGCGVDYAHVHLVPFRQNLLERTKRMFPEIVWREVSDFNDSAALHSIGKSYWYLYQPEYNLCPLIGVCDEVEPSQLFRKAIANTLVRPDDYDWKTNPFVEVMERTCEKLSQVTA